MIAVLKNENNDLKEQLNSCAKSVRELRAIVKVAQSKPVIVHKTFHLEDIEDQEDLVKFYTGFESYQRLQVFLNFVIEGYLHEKSKTFKKVDGRPEALDIKNQIFLVLCRLRVGLLEKDLAHRFGISVSTVSKIWSSWLKFLSSFLSQVPIWPSAQTVHTYMPEEFTTMYPTTRVILDCTEIFIENPSEFRVQSSTYSSYKSHNTAKGLIGITPNGFISLVSDLAPGRISDKEITKDSGLYKMLDRGDSVMADRGFLIEDALSEVGVKLNIPPFMKGQSQLTVEDEKLTRDIAKLRIHVERVIRGVKEFRILKYIFPNSMSSKLDQIWKLCCILNNFTNEPLLNRK